MNKLSITYTAFIMSSTYPRVKRCSYATLAVELGTRCFREREDLVLCKAL